LADGKDVTLAHVFTPLPSGYRIEHCRVGGASFASVAHDLVSLAAAQS
jgi:hypothetical protein